MAQGPRRPGRPGPVSDIERFLMEVERLRKKAADDRPVDDVEVVERPQPARPAPPPPPPPVRVRPRPVEAQEILDVIPVAQPAPAPQGVPATVQATATVQVLGTVQATQRVAAVTSAARRSVLAGDLRALLRSRQQVRTALLLTEILGPPLSRRRGRR